MIQTYEEQVAWVINSFTGTPYVTARRSFPSEAGQPMPRAEILLDEFSLGISRDELLLRLASGDPAISLAPSGVNGLFVNPQTLSPGQEQVIVKQIYKILKDGSDG